MGKGCHDGKQHLALGIHRVDGFLLEKYRNVLIFQLTDVFQVVQGVSGKSADGFSLPLDMIPFNVLTVRKQWKF